MIETDYENYSIIYACRPNSRAFLWFNARTPFVSDEMYNYMMEKAKATLPNFDFEELVMDKQDLKKCKYIKDTEEVEKIFEALQ